MNGSLSSDLKRLKSLAYHRHEWGKDWVCGFYKLPAKAKSHPDYHLLEKLRLWLLSPITLWPADLNVIAEAAMEFVVRGKQVDATTALVVELLSTAPSEMTQEAVAQHEHEVQSGIYEHLLHIPEKFDHKEKELEGSREFKAQWRSICRLFSVAKFRDRKGIIRRRFIQERGFRDDWDLDWKNKDERFHALFNTFCHRWSLYGMHGDQPMLLKMTVNLTPYGTMIFVPVYWNFDPKRDLKWGAITALHRSRGVVKQGAKLGLNRMARKEDAERARSLLEEAKAS